MELKLTFRIIIQVLVLHVIDVKYKVDGVIAIQSSQDRQRIADLEGQMKTMADKVQALENQNVVLTEHLQEHLKTTTLSNEFQENQQVQLDVLTNLIKHQRSWLVDIKAFTKNRPSGPPNGHTQTTPVVPTLTAKPSSDVVFSAYMDIDMDNPGKDQTIIFNKALINEGGAYNEHTGVFTCPQNGLYDFFFAIGQRDKNGGWTKLLVNSDVMVAASVDAEHKYQDIQGGNRVFARLTKGDAVRIVVHSGATHIEGDINRFTTFSGILVSA